MSAVPLGGGGGWGAPVVPWLTRDEAGPESGHYGEILVTRLSVGEIRRARGEEADVVSRDWEVAELSDGGRLVRLAASPEDLRLVPRELGLTPCPSGA